MAKNQKAKPAPSECPVCGAAVPATARSCPSCGADERTGWNEETTRYDGLNLPEEAFDDEPGPRAQAPKDEITRRGAAFFWWIIGIGLIATLVYLLLHPFFQRI
jgi:hypothetical protein